MIVSNSTTALYSNQPHGRQKNKKNRQQRMDDKGMDDKALNIKDEQQRMNNKGCGIKDAPLLSLPLYILQMHTPCLGQQYRLVKDG